MTSRRTAMLLLAAALAAPSAPAVAQGAAGPLPVTAPKPPHAKKKPAKGTARTAAAPSPRSPIVGTGGEDEASSLERRRKAFFATKPDEGGPEQPAAPSAGVTLGGSGGITPGMGFKF